MFDCLSATWASIRTAIAYFAYRVSTWWQSTKPPTPVEIIPVVALAVATVAVFVPGFLDDPRMKSQDASAAQDIASRMIFYRYVHCGALTAQVLNSLTFLMSIIDQLISVFAALVIVSVMLANWTRIRIYLVGLRNKDVII